MVNSPLIRPYFLRGWHWGGTLRFPRHWSYYSSSKGELNLSPLTAGCPSLPAKYLDSLHKMVGTYHKHIHPQQWNSSTVKLKCKKTRVLETYLKKIYKYLECIFRKYSGLSKIPSKLIMFLMFLPASEKDMTRKLIPLDGGHRDFSPEKVTNMGPWNEVTTWRTWYRKENSTNFMSVLEAFWK